MTDPEKYLAYGQPDLSAAEPDRTRTHDGDDQDENSMAVDDTQAEKPLQKWNDSRINMLRFFVTLFSFIIMGMNDAVVGALIPYIGPFYNVQYTILALVFLAPFAGYLLAAMTNNLIHHHFGQLGVAVLGPLCHLIGYIILAVHPPFAVLPIAMLIPAYGNGLEDSAWNAWVGNMQSANELLGFLHGAYGLGAAIGPLISTAMVTRADLQWYTFYYVMIGLAALESILSVAAFWQATAKVHRAGYTTAGDGRRVTTREVLKSPVVWLLAFFLLAYVGAEVSLGGWIVEFMLRVRHAENFDAGMSVFGFWLGLTVGRIVLGFFTGRIGEKLAITIYLLLCIVFQLLYWFVPNFFASTVFVAFLGFFLGPLFPAAIVAATKLLPSDYHVSAIGFMAAFGGGGAAIFPFAVGAIAQHNGVEVLQPVALAILAFCLVLWFVLPGGMKPGGLEKARETKETIGVQYVHGYRWLKAKARRS